MDKRLLAAAIAIAASALLAAGCGGSDEPDAVVEDFYAATADGDAEQLCALVTDETAQSAAEQEDAETCEEGVEKSFASEGAEEAASLAEDVEVGDATIDGETATVEVSAAGQSDEVNLVKVDDEWKVDLGE
jgi:hypothetical protein